MTRPAAEVELDERMQNLETLIEEFEQQADPAARARLSEILQTLLEFHGAGLRKILAALAEFGEAGREIIGKFAGDGLISNLLVLHDLHPDDVQSRVERGLDSVRPYLASHGGRVELVGFSDEGMVQLRLEGSCHGCPSSRVTLKNSVETAVYAAAPEVTGIEVQGLDDESQAPPASGFVPLNDLTTKSKKPVYENCGIPSA